MRSPRPAARPRHRKIVPLGALAQIVRRAKASGRTVVLTNGCFDLLHPGHVDLLERARRYGDLLIVALNSDGSVKALKGPQRPILPQRDRATLLAALAGVDFVTIFHDPTPQRVIARLRPQVLVKGADWGPQAVVGRDVVERDGGRVVRIPLVTGYSTTRLIERLSAS